MLVTCSALQSDWARAQEQQLKQAPNMGKSVHEQRHLWTAKRSSASLGHTRPRLLVLFQAMEMKLPSSGHQQHLWDFEFHAKEILGGSCSAFNLEVNLLRAEIANSTVYESIFLCICTAGRTRNSNSINFFPLTHFSALIFQMPVGFLLHK